MAPFPSRRSCARWRFPHPRGDGPYLGTERYTVLLRLPDGHGSGRDIAPLVRAFQSELRRREVPAGKLAVTDDEIILPSWAGLRVKTIGKLQDTRTGKSVEIILEEVKP